MTLDLPVNFHENPSTGVRAYSGHTHKHTHFALYILDTVLAQKKGAVKYLVFFFSNTKKVTIFAKDLIFFLHDRKNISL